MTTQLQELKKATEAIINMFAQSNITLDYSLESAKFLDQLFDQEYKKGKLINPKGNFAKYEGLLLTGVAGYLADIMLKNSTGSKIEIDSSDEDWYVNFKVVAVNTWTVLPGQRVMKRKFEGYESNFYHYVLAMSKYFNESDISSTETSTHVQEIYIENNSPKKPWWRLW